LGNVIFVEDFVELKKDMEFAKQINQDWIKLLIDNGFESKTDPDNEKTGYWSHIVLFPLKQFEFSRALEIVFEWEDKLEENGWEKYYAPVSKKFKGWINVSANKYLPMPTYSALSLIRESKKNLIF